MSRVVFVVAPSNFRDEELFEPLDELKKAGVETTISSTKVGECIGKLGGKVNSELLVDEVDTKKFEGVVFVGGNGVLEHKLYENEGVLKLAKDFYNTNKLVCAICIAPRILTCARVINGRKATTFPDEQNIEEIKAQGVYTGKSVEVDGKLVTADGPQSARRFGKAIVKALK